MARTFNGTSNDFVTTTGALSGMTYGTVAALFRLNGLGQWQGLFYPYTTAGTYLGAVAINPSNQMQWADISNNPTSGVALSSGVWYLQVVRKATGSNAPRFSGYNFTTGAWSHTAGGSAAANWTAPGAGGSIKCTFEGTGDWLKADLAVRAAWANVLPWAASSGGDLVLEAAGLQHSLQAWWNAAPSALWVFDQADTTQKVPDLTGGGANQSSLAGTTVATNAVPFGYGADMFDLRTAPSTPPPEVIEGAQNSTTMYSQTVGVGGLG